jgi:hypothetical protein
MEDWTVQAMRYSTEESENRERNNNIGRDNTRRKHYFSNRTGAG